MVRLRGHQEVTTRWAACTVAGHAADQHVSSRAADRDVAAVSAHQDRVTIGLVIFTGAGGGPGPGQPHAVALEVIGKNRPKNEDGCLVRGESGAGAGPSGRERG